MPFAARSLAPALSCALALSAGPALAQAAPPERPPGHLRLIDKLDRPDDGYCLDIMGSGDHIRPDLPMTAHNCKPGLYADEAVRLEPDGRLYFPAYRLCATVAGLNGRALAGAALVPRPCGERSAFMEADALQRFDIVDAACVHRSGDLAIGELAVWVGVSAAHRDAAFAACRWIIDEVKARVPIWTRER